MPFVSFKKLDIPDVVLIEPVIYKDERGFFLESYKKSAFNENGLDFDFVQDNHSRSAKDVLRGLHLQINPMAQGKLVRCVRGKVLDVAVDLRKNSKHYKKWIAVELSEENQRVFYIPVGFAHGFLTLSDSADILYKTTREYSQKHEVGIIWNDPSINITWPTKNPLLSDKDKKNLPLKEVEDKLIF